MTESAPPPLDPSLLLEAFESFSKASQQLERAYEELKSHTEKLDLELRESNQRLSHALQEQEHLSLHLSSTLNAMKTGIIVVDLSGSIVEMNPSACLMLKTRKMRGHYSQAHLPDTVRDYIQSCLEHTLSRIPRQQISLGEGDEELTLELSFSPVRPEGGGIMSVLILLNDVTLINRLKSQSNRNARLAAMGEMAAELAHEIRNPLGSIKLFASLIKGDLGPEHASSPLAEHINQAVQTIDNIVSNMLTFSADITPHKTDLSLEKLIRDSMALFEMERQKKEIQVSFHSPSSPTTIQGDTHLLKQMVLNLCLNAIKAMNPRGTLKITLQAREDYLEMIVADNGSGIPKSQLHKVFDPFFSTFQGGTGLGLSVVHKIIESHQGAIDIRSELGKGTSVFVSLPMQNPGRNAEPS